MTEQTQRTERKRRRGRSDKSDEDSRSGYAKSIQRAKREDSAIADTDWSPSGVWQPSGTTDDADFDMEDHHIQRALKGTGTSQNEVPDQVLDVVGSGGQALDYDLQQNLESKMGADFSDVRIHTGGKAASAAEAIDARAFTCGNDIVFNSGEYNPDSAEGQFLLAHELAHVKQQTGDAPLSMMPKSDADLEIDPDPQLERQADEAAKDALVGEQGPATVSRMGTDVHVQRLSKDKGLDALALFDIELWSGSSSEHMQEHNELQFNYLKGMLDELVGWETAKRKKQNMTEESGMVGGQSQSSDQTGGLSSAPTQSSDSPGPLGSSNTNGDHRDEIRDKLNELNDSLGEKLDDVAMTKDQWETFESGVDTSFWEDVSTATITTVTSSIVGWLLAGPVGAVAAPAVSLGMGAIEAHVANNWDQTSGDLEERIEQIKEMILEEEYFEEDESEGVVESQR